MITILIAGEGVFSLIDRVKDAVERYVLLVGCLEIISFADTNELFQLACLVRGERLQNWLNGIEASPANQQGQRLFSSTSETEDGLLTQMQSKEDTTLNNALMLNVGRDQDWLKLLTTRFRLSKNSRQKLPTDARRGEVYGPGLPGATREKISRTTKKPTSAGPAMPCTATTSML